ncbi:MAG: D-alanyl-D-alanine carboxypeptidase/D-alanyl-D-alanine-endopeptidase [Kibdelosporangium sp.]
MTWDHRPSRRTVLGALAAAGVVGATGTAFAESGLPGRIEAILGRPEFQGSHWGMAFHSPGGPVHAMNPGELFVAASSMKIFIGATAFETLGPGHRFHTRVFRTGPVTSGVLRGDLVVVAGGDMLLSNRARPDGTIEPRHPDHANPGAPPLPGDRLADVRELAAQVRASGIRRVEGRVVVDTSLFREARESIAFNNAMITVSPMMINDHVVHAVVTPGDTVGAPAVVQSNPSTAHVRFVSEVTTIAASGTPRRLAVTADGRVTGDIRLGGQTEYVAHYVPDPTQFAATVFKEALQDKGIQVDGQACPARPNRAEVAEHVSLPLSEQAKVMLKVSSNIHTVSFPYLVGAIAGGERENPKASYEDYRRSLFRAAGLPADPAGAADGNYSADTFIAFLNHVAKRPYFAQFRDSLPIMGRDGTLMANQPNSPAAGNVYAKTGSGVRTNPAGGVTVNKALAGYIRMPGRRWFTFAQFMTQDAPSMAAANALVETAQEAMAEIVTGVYELGGTSR